MGTSHNPFDHIADLDDDDSDIGDLWRQIKKEGQQRRGDNRENSTKLLEEVGVKFESKNFGAHLIVNGGILGKIDFWPGTGKFVLRASGVKGRGVFKLLKLVSPDYGSITLPGREIGVDE